MGESQRVRQIAHNKHLFFDSRFIVCFSYSDFGGIFAELLPGNFAKLQPPEGQDLMQGLEVKVQLGSVWKQSLTELSGGQRSVTNWKHCGLSYSSVFIMNDNPDLLSLSR